MGFLLSFLLDSGEFCHQFCCVIFIIIIGAAVNVLQQKLIIDLWREGGERERGERGSESERDGQRGRERGSL